MDANMILAQKLASCRAVNISGLWANVIAATTPGCTPMLPVATEDVLDVAHIQQLSAMYTWMGRPMIAESIANEWSVRNGVRENDRILARAYGEMMCIKMVKDRVTLEHKNSARREVLNILRRQTPKIRDLRLLITDIINDCAKCSELLVTEQECRLYIPAGTSVTMQVLKFSQRHGHLIPTGFLANDEARAVWADLSGMVMRRVNLADLQIDIVADVKAIWVGLPDRAILGYHEAKVIQMTPRARCLMLAVMFTYVATLSKSSNVTHFLPKKESSTGYDGP
ncbi:uncharacterized protein LOC144473258 [Augochlora pura]